MATFTFSLVDESAGVKSSLSYTVTDKESQRILDCYIACHECQDAAQAFAVMATNLIGSVLHSVAAYERRLAVAVVVPIVPQRE